MKTLLQFLILFFYLTFVSFSQQYVHHSGKSHELNDVLITDANHSWAISDSGTSWTPQPLPLGTRFLLTIDFSSNAKGFSGGWREGQNFGFEGAGVYTTNGGSVWELSSLPDSTRAIIYSKIFNNLTGIAAAAYNYYDSPKANLSEYLNELYREKKYTQIPYALLGFIREAKTGGIILKTNDAGATWNTITALPDSFSYITGACFTDENNGFIIAPADSLTHILKTTDGGYSWKIKFSFPPSSGSKSIVFSSPLKGIAVGYNLSNTEQGLVAVTNDGGENWTYQFIQLAGNLAAASFSNENTFYATGQNLQNSYVLKSTNAGFDWFQTSFSSTEFFLDGINFLLETNSGFIFGIPFSLSKIFVIKTFSGGDTWSEPAFITSFSGSQIFSSKILDENNVYLCGGNFTGQGLILKTSNALLSVESNLLTKPNDFYLEQNFPNPFNPSTRIQYQVSSSSHVALKVYDVLGNEVATLVNEAKPIGTYEVTWNAVNLPSGVYFYRIQSGPSTISGQVFIDTKKMLLLR
jgi:hypothetical protein